MTAADVIQQTQHKMGVPVEKLRDDFTRIRTGRASTGDPMPDALCGLSFFFGH